MSPVRFFALRWTPVDRDSEAEGRRLIARVERHAAWERLIDWRGFVLLAQREEPGRRVSVFGGGYGAAFGATFQRATALALGTICARDAAMLSEDGGSKLIANYWGAYVAFLIDRGHDLIHVVRDPTGGADCFYARIGRVHVLFSNAEDYGAAGARLEPDVAYIAGFLINSGLSISCTGLEDGRELQAGERLTFSRTECSRSWLWRPDEFSRCKALMFEPAAKALRSTAAECVGAWARARGKILHRLSGGLDSTIVLALMRQCAPEATIVCANEYSETAPEGDERVLARIAAQTYGAPLIEVRMRPDAVRFERALEAPLTAKPALSLLSFADHTLADLAREQGALLVTSGQAGDHLFHRRRTPLVAADAVRDGLPARRCARIAMDAARLSGASVWSSAAAMLRYGVLGRTYPIREHMVRQAPWVLGGGATEAIEEWAAHDWIAAASVLPPARALRVWHYMDALRYHAPSGLNAQALAQPPLLSRPIVELCLSIPPYVMTEGGRERALARAAFAEYLPPEIAKRTTKGESTRYFAAVLAHNTPVMRDLLLGGELERHRLVDRRAIEAVLRGQGTHAGAVQGLLSCLAAEIWLRNLKRANARLLAQAIPSGQDTAA